MNTQWVRVAYVCVFLLAALAVFSAWSQIGGQGHLDLVPWYWKLTLGCGLSASIVGLTDAISSESKLVTRRSAMWMLVVLLVAGAMGAVTYHSHLNEAVEEPGSESEEETTAWRLPPEQPLFPATRPIMR
jgi:hypothetical protein